MSLETFADRNLVLEILKPCGLLPAKDVASETLQELVIRVPAEDPVFTWVIKKDGSEHFPVGFMYSKMRDGSYVLLANEDESATDLAERVKNLADECFCRESANRIIQA